MQAGKGLPNDVMPMPRSFDLGSFASAAPARQYCAMYTGTARQDSGSGVGDEAFPFVDYAPPARRSVQNVAGWFGLAACFLLSWQLVRVPELNFTLSDGFLLLALGTLLLAGQVNPAPFGRLTMFWTSGLLLLLGGLFIGSVAHEQIVRWSNVASQYFIALMILPIVLASFDRDFLARAALFFAYGVAVSQLIGILALQLFGYEAVIPYVGRTVVLGNDRIGAMTAEPNANGAVCVFALIILIRAVVERRLHIGRGAFVAAIILAGLVFSASFTALLALGAAVGVISLLTWSRGFRRIGVPILVVVVLYIGLGGPLPQVFVERVAGAVFSLDLSKAGTFVSRTVLIGEAWDLADPHLIIGMGVDLYREASVHGAPVHNLALLLLNEGGAISLVGLATVLLCLFAAAIMVGRMETVGGAVCFASLVVILIYTMSLPHMYARHWFGPVILIVVYYMVPRLQSVFVRGAHASSGAAIIPPPDEYAGLQGSARS